MRRCLGFGSRERNCSNKAGPKSKFWCNACEKARRAYISQRLAESEAAMKERP